MDRRLALIRCVLLVTAGIVFCGVDWLWLGAVSIGLGLMMPAFSVVCGCCGSTATSQAQIDITGIANGSCGTCTTYNTSYVVTATSNPTLGTDCEYFSSSLFNNCQTDEGVYWLWENSPFASNRAELKYNTYGNIGARFNGTTGANSQDCSSSVGSLTYDSLSPHMANCDFTTAAATHTNL